MDLGALISRKRKQVGMTIDELASRSGVPKGTLNKIINGITRDPQLETVKSIARALDCTLDDFDDSPRPRRLTLEENSFMHKYRCLDTHGQKLLTTILEFEYTRVIEKSATPSNTIEFSARSRPPWTIFDQTVSAGNGMYLGDESAKSYYLPESGADCVRYADFGIRVSGDSMEPRFHDGDILMVQKTETLEVGEIGVVIMDGEGYVKQIGPGQLISLNPRYAPIPMTDNICITGRVTGVLPYTLDELTPVSSDD